MVWQYCWAKGEKPKREFRKIPEQDKIFLGIRTSSNDFTHLRNNIKADF